MAYCYNRDFMFCDVCGSQLLLNSPKYATCPNSLCNFKKSSKHIKRGEIHYTITAEDIRRELKIDPFVQLTTVAMGAEQPQQKKVTDTPCPMCRHPKLEYYSRQMRSADEGETVFYECPNCHHKFTENN
ncbi:hypothetical protein ZOSMA_77G00190 [Zostera marina]|uniref:DNA-directed RNA polymerase subunit n=1 Tax=Zostera marina TaxID=29655 RepID=A0A0K9NQV3_ZOSMR|nr:hypothetical protein ZOSMA_77G00190 [Zostera marina]